MECPNIDGLRLSSVSRAALEDIRRRHRLGRYLVEAIGAGTVANIFLGNGLLESTYSLSSTDFDLMAKAMRAAPLLVRQAIEREAAMTWLRVSDPKEKAFWRAVEQGCKGF